MVQKNALIASGDSFVIVARPHNAHGYTGVDENVDVKTVKRLTYFETAYSDIKRAHGQKHMKGLRLHACLNKHFDKKLFTNMCSICRDKRPAQH